jgi:hypothetical protein
MRRVLNLILGLLALGLSGCYPASYFLGSTTVRYSAATGDFFYSSNKNQEGLKAKAGLDPETGKLTNLDIETTATTPEAAIIKSGEATAAANANVGTLLGIVKPLIDAGVAAATKGAVLPKAPVSLPVQ